jgi:hypothetical protein
LSFRENKLMFGRCPVLPDAPRWCKPVIFPTK